MAERVRVKKSQAKREAALEQAAPKKSDEELKAEIDALLDDIDAVLEENAADFVAGYVQKGGE